MTARKRHPGRRGSRRGAALAAAVLILAAANLAVIGAVTARGDDARIAVRRADTLRAFYAAESAVSVARNEIAEGRAPPAGVVSIAGGATFEMTISSPSPPLDVTITGRYSDCARRIVAHVE